MKPLALKPVNSQPEPQKISIDMAEQIADRAARKASEETALKTQEISRETMESFNKSQEQNNQVSRDSIYEEPDGGYSIDSRTEKNLMRRLLDQTLQKALDPPAPSPIENAVNQVMNTVSAGIAEKMLGNIGGTVPVISKASFLMDILNSQFGAGLGQTLGTNLPQVIQSLTGAIGQQKTKELVDNINSKMGGGSGDNSGNVGNTGGNEANNANAEKQKDMVLALDINNIEHVKQYASAMGLTEKAARGMLQIHQDDIVNERKIFSGSGINSNVNNSEITQALTVLIQEMTGMKTVINNLQNEIVTLKGGNKPSESVEVNTDSRWGDDNQQQVNVSTSPVGGRNVTLFQSPIKVDVDDIKGNSDPFFNETPKQNSNVSVTKNNEPKESVLEESKDSEGNSTFKMSDEVNKKEQINDDNKKEPLINNIEKVIEPDVNVTNNKTLDKQVDNKQVDIKQENEKPVYKKRIIRKPLTENVENKESQSPSKERYDIDNNLIVEDKQT